jgi:hypothetical protein
VTLIAATIDPDGRRVNLTDEHWQYVKSEHPDIAPYLREVMAAVREPDRRSEGRRPDETWFFAESVGPGPWLRVVVHYEGGEGWIVTAHAQRPPPRA